MPKVAIVKGNDRKENITKSLKSLKKTILRCIDKKNSDTLFIKVNTIDPNFPLACTHPDALEVVLEFFINKFNRIVIGDNSFAFSKNQNIYTHLIKKLELKFDAKLKFSDLSEFDSKKLMFKQIDGSYKHVRVSSLPDEAFTISLALPKTHDTVIFTGCSKNMVGCLVKDRMLIHGLNFYHRILMSNTVRSFRITNENIAELLSNVKPDLSILDGFVGMEGNGPLHGKKVKLEIAMCSDDCIALDSTAAKIIGFDFIPYLFLCEKKGIGTTNIGEIHILKDGFENLKEISRNFKPHYLYKYQISEYGKTCEKIPIIDFRLLLTFMKRYYRIKDKILEMIRK